MADDNNEDDSWLYGSSAENQENQNEEQISNEKCIPSADQEQHEDSKQETGEQNVTNLKTFFCHTEYTFRKFLLYF